MAIDVASLANAVIDTYWPRFVRLPFANRALFDFPSSPYSVTGMEDGPEGAGGAGPRGLLPILPPEQSFDNFEVLTSTTQVATAMTEYGAPGAAGNDTFASATAGVISAWIPVNITGFALDRLNNARMGDIIGWAAKKFSTAFKQLGDYINGVLLGATASGIIGCVDDATTYGGINPAVTTAWQSKVNKTGGILSTAIMKDVWFDTTGGNRQANEDDLVWLFPQNQIERYSNIGEMLTANAEVQKVVNAVGGPLDLGYSGYSYNTRPIIKIPDMSTTTILLMNMSEAHIEEVRSLQIVAKPYAGDGELFYVAWRGKLVVPNKFQCGKAEGLTA